MDRVQLHVFFSVRQQRDIVMQKIRDDANSNVKVFIRSIGEDKEDKYNLYLLVIEANKNTIRFTSTQKEHEKQISTSLLAQNIFKYYKEIKANNTLYEQPVKYVFIATQDKQEIEQNIIKVSQSLNSNQMKEMTRKISEEKDVMPLFLYYDKYYELIKRINEYK